MFLLFHESLFGVPQLFWTIPNEKTYQSIFTKLLNEMHIFNIFTKILMFNSFLRLQGMFLTFRNKPTQRSKMSDN